MRNTDMPQRRTMLTLPTEVAQHLTNLPTEARPAYLHALRDLGWTYQSLAEPLGVSRERVRQIIAAAPESAAPEGAPLTAPPQKEKKAPREFIEPDPDVLARLLELQPIAQKVRSNNPEYREEAEEYTKLVWQQHHDQKVTLYRLAKRLGVTHGALRFRLVRYGYMEPKTGQSKVYQSIKTANRSLQSLLAFVLGMV